MISRSAFVLDADRDICSTRRGLLIAPFLAALPLATLVAGAQAGQINSAETAITLPEAIKWSAWSGGPPRSAAPDRSAPVYDADAVCAILTLDDFEWNAMHGFGDVVHQAGLRLIGHEAEKIAMLALMYLVCRRLRSLWHARCALGCARGSDARAFR
jgi:hypothetical protein